MKTFTGLSRVITAATLLLASFSAVADTRIDTVWTCTLKEGHTVDELQAVHTRWIEWANKQSYGGNIGGAIAQSMVAASFNVFIIDSFPDMATLAAEWQNYRTSEEGQAIEAAYEEVSTCTSNALYAVTTSG